MPKHDFTRDFTIGRRRLLQTLGGLSLGFSLMPYSRAAFMAADDPRLLRTIPVSGELISAVGLGTWITFNVAPLTETRAQRVEVLRSFFALGGTLVDSSPMYGLSEATLGHCLDVIGGKPPLFSATKVWIPTRIAGIAQMKASQGLWGVDRFDLMQIHNMLDWEAHLPTLIAHKAEGRIRYIGITTSHGRRHEAMERVITGEPAFDFVQFSYNIADREAERRLLPAAAAHGKAVIINRPFRTGELFEQVRGKALPDWAGDIGCQSWAGFFLKFVLSHTAVTCAIPATSRVDHMNENMQSLRGPLPDAAMRRRMIEYFERL